VVFDVVWVCDLKEDEVLEVEIMPECVDENRKVLDLPGMVKMRVNDEVVVLSVSGLGCDADNEGEV